MSRDDRLCHDVLRDCSRDNTMGHPSTHLNEMHPVLYRTLKLFLPIAIICLSGAFLFFDSEAELDLLKLRTVDHAAVQTGSHSIENIVNHVTRNLGFLSEHRGLKRLVTSGESRTDHSRFHDDLISDWLTLSQTNRNYDQIRWIDQTGQERVRVNFNSGKPVAVDQANLQNKGNRYYFTDTLKLNKGEFFISPLDLNMEHGEIERPLKPMIRIGTPVFDEAGQRKGFCCLTIWVRKY